MKVPDWPAGTVCVLSTAGEEPHAIPVSTAVRLSDSVVAFALGRRRGSLERLRVDGRCSLTVLCAEDLAFTLYGTATTAGEVEGSVAVRLSVDRVEDHMQDTFSIKRGVFWHWLDAEAAEKDAAIRAGLAELA